MVPKGFQSGFTLIELLVVLAIVGAVGAIVAPNMWNSLQRSSEHKLALEFAGELMKLRREAHVAGKSLIIPENTLSVGAAGSILPILPIGWVMESQSDIFFLPSGVTNGGLIVFSSSSGRVWELTIQALDGEVEIINR